MITISKDTIVEKFPTCESYEEQFYGERKDKLTA